MKKTCCKACGGDLDPEFEEELEFVMRSFAREILGIQDESLVDQFMEGTDVLYFCDECKAGVTVPPALAGHDLANFNPTGKPN